MIKSVALPAKQIAAIVRGQSFVERAQSDLDIVLQTILAGLDITGQIVSVDIPKNLLNIEVPDEAA